MSLARVATACMKHAWFVVAVWGVVLVAGVATAPLLFDRLTSEAGTIDDSESHRAAQVVKQADPAGAEIYAVADGTAAEDPRLRESVARVAALVGREPGVAAVQTPWSAGGAATPSAVSRDGHAIAIRVRFEKTQTGRKAIEPVRAMLRSIEAPHVVVGGGPLLGRDMDDQAGSDLALAELLSTPVVLLLLVVIFGGLVAAGLPLLLMIVSVGATMGLLMMISRVSDVSVYAVNIVTMLGLGLAVDYALLIVSRFREERAVQLTPVAAVQATFATAGRTVAFSGLTVAASLAALTVFPDDFLRSMGIAGLAVVLIDLVAALTLMPALLGLAGHRIRAAAPSPSDGRVFVRLARVVRRRPLVVLSVCGALLLLTAMPFLGATFAEPDERSLPSGAPSRQLNELVHTRFALPSDADPVTVVARAPVPPAELRAYVEQLRSVDGVQELTVRTGVPGLTVIDLRPEGDSQAATGRHLVSAVRALPSPVPVQVSGKAATLIDYQQALLDRAPWAFGILFTATFVLLFLFTGSVVLPIKAILMNLLSLSAGFGALVWVFQDGHLGRLVGTEALGSLSITTPVLVFAIAFGLSMDYEVFLIGRISETYRRTGDNDLAVEEGLRRTGGVITAASLLMAIVFAAFVAGGFSPVKQVGFGLVLAVLLDATAVRMLIVPAFMTMMGQANWWSPPVLRRLHERIGLTEGAHPQPAEPELATVRSV